ncbi:MAG: hypothetical protein A2X48_18580 [Lentisphaerae bacterium GWF2_49_21]|nr:MAG: hypothetical protein A2X48_18580 [Lentisphaerae bacterium GWF2_49_21]
MLGNNTNENSVSTVKYVSVYISFYFGLFTLMAGLFVLAGWMFDIPSLKSVLPWFVTMKANTAVAFALAGLSLMLLALKNPSLLVQRLSQVFAAFVALIGFLTICEYLFGVQLGIDQLFFRESVDAVGTLSPGRMAPNTAITFILLGCTLILVNFRRSIPSAQRLALLIGIMGVVPLIGYLYGATVFIGIGYYTQMAVHTAVLFIIVGSGVIMLHPADGFMRTVTSDKMGGWLLRHLLPLLLGIPFIIGWFWGQGEKYGYFENALGVSLMIVFMMLILTGLAWGWAKTLNGIDADRKQSEDSLRESEESYRRLFEAAKDGILLLDFDTGVITDANQFLKDRLGYPNEELLDKHLWEVGLFKDIVSSKDAFLQLQTQKYIRYEDLPLETKDGKKLDVEFISNVYQAGGKKVIQCNIRDITERKKVTIALRESEKRFIDLLYASRDAILLIDGETFVDCNEATAKMLGYSNRNQFLMTHPSKLSPPTQPDGRNSFEKANEMMRTALESGFHRFEWMHRRANGEDFPVEVSLTPIAIKGKNILHCVWRDITEHKKLEIQLRQSQKMEAVGQLAGGVAHDFNNMLSVINGYSEMLLREITPADPKYDRIKEIHKAGERSAELTRQLLAFARKQTIAPKILDVNDSVTGMLKMLQRLIGESSELLWKPAANPWKVKMDPSQLNQILTNLLVNARDAISGAGKIVIETCKMEMDEAFCRIHPDAVPGKYVVLEVSDNGCGMNKETLERIFEPFFTTKKVGEGTGLGLATVFGIVKQNNGVINVYSEIGKGTIFKIYLPRHESENEEKDEIIDMPVIIKGTETVLLVEDDKSLLLFARTLLERFGYTVLDAGTPVKAIKLAAEYTGGIHLLMTDVVMPEMSGRDLRDKIMAARPGIKCLFMSGYTASVMSKNGILDEGINFLQKPFTAIDLSTKLREALA